MSNTIADVVSAARWYLQSGGYYEKASGDAKYLTDEVEVFNKNKGSANWTYFGKLCGINPGAWCAMFVSTCVYKAVGKDKEKAKKAMHGVWPYTACNQLFDAAPDTHRFYGDYQRFTLGKGDRVRYTPCAGDVIVFTDNGRTRTHTGLVTGSDDTYVYTIEGNSANMVRTRSYRRDSSYIYGYVMLNLPVGEAAYTVLENYGRQLTVGVHELSKGCAGPEVERWQALLVGLKITDDSGALIAVDGDFGTRTKQATVRFQKRLFPEDGGQWDGVVGSKTWEAALCREME